MLQARLAKRLGAFQLDVELRVPESYTLALVGESGSGKSTVLRLLAGLLRPDRGRIAVRDAVWFDSERAFERPARTREIGYVAQDYALFPHLTVAENVAFGLRAQGIPGRVARDRVQAMLERLAIAPLAERRPDQLSGGQRQRVALARALVLEPHLLLLDEPLAALDLGTRRAVRGELRRLLEQLPCVTVFVTHDPTEALVFGDEIAALEAGAIRQVGPADELLRHPRSAMIAEFMGLNLLRGAIAERLPDGLLRVRVAGGEVVAPDADAEAAGAGPGTPQAHDASSATEIYLVIDPREIVLSNERPLGSAQNVLPGTIEEITPEPPLGQRLRVVVASQPRLVAEVTAQAARTLGLRVGSAVFAAFKATGVTSFR